MTPVRHRLIVGLVVLVTAPALAQGLRSPPPARPGFRPLFPSVLPSPPLVRPGLPGLTPGVGWQRPIYPGYYPYLPMYGSSYSYYPPTSGFSSSPVLAPPPLQGAGGTPIAIDPELSAELTVEFPASPEVTVNGTVVPGEGNLVTLRSPALRSGLTHSFAVKARWTLDGQKYEWERTVVLGSGERSRITVARGFPVNDKE